MRVKEILRLIDQLAPFDAAAEWDHVGLQVGSADAPVSCVLVALDLDDNVLNQAIKQGAQVIVTHHPTIFGKLDKLTQADRVGRLVLKAVRHEINLIAAHTNLDVAPKGVSYLLAERLGLSQHKVFVETSSQKLVKLAVMVPLDYQDKVREAICAQGAGFIGNYSHCTFSYQGTGTFKPESGATPFLGEINQIERVAEVKIETIVPQNLLGKVLNSMFAVHPYEEVAYDIIPLGNKGQETGFGRIGKLPEALRTEEFLSKVKQVLSCPFLRLAGYYPDKVTRVAVVGGSGADYIERAGRVDADVFITADVKYHQAVEAAELGLLLVDPGHDVSEQLIVPALAQYLTENLSAKEVKVIPEKPRQPLFTMF